MWDKNGSHLTVRQNIRSFKTVSHLYGQKSKERTDMQHQTGMTCLSITHVYKAPAAWGTAYCVVFTESDHIKLLWRLADWQLSLAGQQETSGLHPNLCDITRLPVRPEDTAASRVQVAVQKKSWKTKHDYINVVLTIYITNRTWYAGQGTKHLCASHI